MQDLQQHGSGAALGPFKAIGGTSQEQCCAHSRRSAVSLMNNTGPIRDLKQHVSEVTLGPFKAISSTSQEQHWARSRP
jgi:hypothetical protein